MVLGGWVFLMTEVPLYSVHALALKSARARMSAPGLPLKEFLAHDTIPTPRTLQQDYA